MAKIYKGDSLLAHIDFNVMSDAVKVIDSSDSSNPVNLRSLESGLYKLYGYFIPYEGYAGSMFTVPAPLFGAVVNNGTISYIQLYFAYNNMIQYFELTDSSFTNKNVMLSSIGELSNLKTTNKTSIVDAINELYDLINQ